MHRASLGKWYHPKEVVPGGSKLDEKTGGMQTPLLWNAGTDAYTLELQVPAKLAPVNLSFTFLHPGERKGGQDHLIEF